MRQILPLGGTPPYKFELAMGPGIVVSSGHYVGDGREGVAIVRVVDGAGAVAYQGFIVGKFYSPLIADANAAAADSTAGTSPLSPPLTSTSATFRSPLSGLLVQPGFNQLRIQSRGTRIEGPRENRFRESERFDPDMWTPGGVAPAPFAEIDVATAPDGRPSAERLVEGPGAGAGQHQFTVSSGIVLPGSDGTRFVFSCFFKYAGIRNVRMNVAAPSDFATNTQAVFDVHGGLNGFVHINLDLEGLSFAFHSGFVAAFNEVINAVTRDAEFAAKFPFLIALHVGKVVLNSRVNEDILRRG